MAQFNFWPFGPFDLSAKQVHTTLGSAKSIAIIHNIAPYLEVTPHCWNSYNKKELLV